MGAVYRTGNRAGNSWENSFRKINVGLDLGIAGVLFYIQFTQSSLWKFYGTKDCSVWLMVQPVIYSHY